MLHLHNVIRWILLLFLLIAVFRSYTGWQKKSTVTPGVKKLWLFTMIITHINLLVGLYLLFFGRMGIFTIPSLGDISVMKDARLRFFWIEHPVLMLAATTFITIGRGMAKKAIPDTTKYKNAFWFFFLALLLILVAIPWPFREIGRPLLPGM